MDLVKPARPYEERLSDVIHDMTLEDVQRALEFHMFHVEALSQELVKRQTFLIVEEVLEKRERRLTPGG